MNIHIAGYSISSNYKKTKLFYSKGAYITNACKCNYCKNYCLACDYLDLSTKILFILVLILKKKLRFGTYLKMMMAFTIIVSSIIFQEK
ncbi:hypothetical protein, partial [Vagococcus martis]|uniref:hypothetical protein n=1 Tax=Vagococcus martis TaxID=1768210 RepID=UPI001E638411